MKIAVIGAGPAGITLSYHLRNKYKSAEISLFEASERVTGQAECIDYDGVSHPLGTCFTKTGYNGIYQLARKVSAKIERINPSLNFISKNNINKEIVSPTFSSIIEVLILFYKICTYWIIWKICRQDVSPTWKMNQRLFSEFLSLKKIKMNTVLCKISTTGQLYGPPDQITTHNALMWYTPSLFLSSITYHFTVKAFALGYQNLFEKILACSGVNLRLKTPINECKKIDSKVLLSPINETFDLCFVTVPLDKIKTPISHEIAKSGKFKDQYIVSMHFSIDVDFDGNTYCFEACDYLSSVSDLPLGKNRPSTNIRWALARFPYEMTLLPENELIELVKNDIYKITNSKNITVHTMRCFRYNIHYSPLQLENKLPQFIAEKQGEDNIWYSGGTLSHWDVESIHQFNLDLVKSLPSD